MGLNLGWTLAPAQLGLATELARGLSISPLLSQCLLNRGLSEKSKLDLFLKPRLKHLADPLLLPDMKTAVDRLLAARERGERVVIFGDYDVDGVTATALLLQVMRALGWQADYYLPRRLEEGYGLSQEAVQNCLAKLPSTLLLAVDCGSTAVTAIDWLLRRGIDVLVLDHHQCSTPAPPAKALVNPHRVPDASRTFCELCSAGLAFKLAHALVKQMRELDVPIARAFDLRPCLDLVALGTIADLVPLTNENRILVTAGLERLNLTERPGLKALKKVARAGFPIGVYEIGFQLAPRLNAAGRLENAAQALQLLLTSDPGEADLIALALDYQNRERQTIERNIVDQVVGAIRSKFNPETDFVIVEGQLLWHIGVVGIVASRVLREFYRPTIIIGGDGQEWRGSGRSIEGFDLAAALHECKELLLRHGGHAMAAGISIAPANVDAFRTKMNELARRQLKTEQLRPSLRLDAEVALLDLTLERLQELEQIKPTGQGNPPVRFVTRGLTLRRAPQPLGKDSARSRGTKFWVTDGFLVLEAVWWGENDGRLPSGCFDLAFEPQINEFNGSRSVQLKVLDWKSAG
jgi:single-stranded-DNA-specific exonuclease